MSEGGPNKSPRIAVTFVVVGLLLSTAGVLYIMWAGREQELPAESPLSNRQVMQLNALLQGLFLTLLLVGVFAVGSYVMIRIGRATTRKPAADGPHRTEYVDAWSQYRVSDEQISEATGGSPEDPTDES